MKYLIILVFLTGCASTNHPGLNGETYYNHVSQEVSELCEQKEWYISWTNALEQDRQGFIDSLNEICRD